MEEQNLYTIKEAAELTGISESELINLIMKKQLNAIRIGKAIRIKEKDLDKFLDLFTGAADEKKDEMQSKDSGLILYSAEQVAKILQLSVDKIIRAPVVFPSVDRQSVFIFVRYQASGWYELVIDFFQAFIT